MEKRQHSISKLLRMTPEEAKEHHPKVVFVDDDNHIARVTNYEKHGKLTEDFILPLTVTNFA